MSKAQAHVALQSDDTFQQGVKDCLPTVFGYLSIGIAAGVIAKQQVSPLLKLRLCRL